MLHASWNRPRIGTSAARRSSGPDLGQRSGWVTLLFALTEEIAPTSRLIRSGRADAHVAIVCSGMGSERSAEAAEKIAQVAGPEDQLIICGFAGGIVEGASPGSILVPGSVIDHETGDRHLPDREMIAAASAASAPGIEPRTGDLVSVRRVVVTAGDKQSIAEESGAEAVDMETAAAARVASRAGLPWMAVRAITDGIDHDLPLDFNKLSSGGSVTAGRVAMAAMARPWAIPGLVRLGRNSRVASERLAEFLAALLPALPQRQT
jgi:adenosylhomocysteine nucleosidase